MVEGHSATLLYTVQFDAAPGMLAICLVTWQVAAEWTQKRSLSEINSEAVSSVSGQDGQLAVERCSGDSDRPRP